MPSYQVSESASRKRLDSWLAEVAGITRAEVKRMISGGLVTIDGEHPKPSTKISPGQMVEVDVAEAQRTSLDPVPFDIRYEDDHLAVINKPAGVVVHPAPGTSETTLVEALAERMVLAETGDPSRPGIVHRLDRETSGLLVVAKTNDSYSRLVEMMKTRDITREYVALVAGTFEKPTGRIEAPVGRSEKNPTRMGVSASGRDAVTDFNVIEKLTVATLIRIRLLTGRTHQIRVHFAHIGHPVIGDRSYGRNAEKLAREIDLSRPFLHAASISFRHPITDAEFTLSEELPSDLVDALERARALWAIK